MSNVAWPRVEEPFARTLVRNVAIAVSVGIVLGLACHAPRRILPTAAVAFWFSLGGHYVEIAFLNYVRPRISAKRVTQMLVRLLVWFAGGVVLYQGMIVTAHHLGLRRLLPSWWWLGGLGFVAVELLVHLSLVVRRLPNVFRGDG